MHNHDKFELRAISVSFMGYSKVTKGYILYDLTKHVFFVNMEVVFQENIFPFKQGNHRKSSMFLNNIDAAPLDNDLGMTH